MILLAALFAVMGAASNAVGTAFQRKAASTVARGGGLRLLIELAHRPAWVIGIGGVVGAALFQALALVNGPMALVQPLFVLELPFALMIAAPLMQRRLPAAAWWAITGVVTGLALVLGSAAPSGVVDQASMVRWIPVLAACLGAMATAVVIARPGHPPLFRAAVLATASAVGNALTAALLKSATGRFADGGIVVFLQSWQTYGFALTGVSAILLLENALQAGWLTASQPALTIGDATVSLLLGITLFDERIRTGWWLLPEAIGVALIVWGVVRLSHVVSRVQTAEAGPRQAFAARGHGDSGPQESEGSDGRGPRTRQGRGPTGERPEGEG
ncbi:DMT family transporter [Streptomyces sp. Ru72]|uniref:DMT family transporter n=1 Tax=Streptomyces sp. Ru72 TaxID=2080747 RepID=UPI0015E48718|nr:DMT family transporter [Streptomyces sp. Ru72]